jgi:hypothetical protein
MLFDSLLEFWMSLQTKQKNGVHFRKDSDQIDRDILVAIHNLKDQVDKDLGNNFQNKFRLEVLC